MSLVALATALLVGCGVVRVAPLESGVRAEPVPADASTAAGPRHDLAVISIDLDPPVRLLQVGQSAPDVALLAAVDNKGNFTERHVVVTATLRSHPGDELLVQRQQTIASLAPGEAAVVRFAGFPSVPPRDGYLLTVAVDAVAGEYVLANNVRTLPLQLVLAR